MTSRLAGGNDTNDLVRFYFAKGVDDDKQEQSFDPPNAVPTLLTGFYPLDERYAVWILEDPLGDLEIDPVFVDVPLILRFVPFEENHLYVQISTYGTASISRRCFAAEFVEEVEEDGEMGG